MIGAGRCRECGEDKDVNADDLCFSCFVAPTIPPAPTPYLEGD